MASQMWATEYGHALGDRSGSMFYWKWHIEYDTLLREITNYTIHNSPVGEDPLYACFSVWIMSTTIPYMYT